MAYFLQLLASLEATCPLEGVGISYAGQGGGDHTACSHIAWLIACTVNVRSTGLLGHGTPV